MLGSAGSYVPASQDYFVSQLMAAAQAAALREDALRRKSARNENLWNVAQQAEQGGDVRVAARLYQRLALSRPRTEVTTAAQQRLSQIQGSAQSKLQALEDQLNSLRGRGTVPSALQSAKIDAEQVTRIFADLDKLALEYSGVESIETKVQERADRLRRQRQFATVLQEPVASELWKVGQKHEEAQRLCCAFLAYEQAANLAPAPSGEQAKARLRQLEADQSIVAEASKCRNLQLCHEKYRKAMTIKKTVPQRARAYLSEIVELAPPDTAIHKAARDQIAILR